MSGIVHRSRTPPSEGGTQVLRTLTALVALAASATLAGCAGRRCRPRRDHRRRHSGRPPSSAPAAPQDIVMIIRHAGEAGRLRAGASTTNGNEGQQLAHRRRLAACPPAWSTCSTRDPGAQQPGLARTPEGSTLPASTDDGEGQRTRETVTPLGRGARRPGEHRPRPGRREEAREGRPHRVGGDADLVAARRDPRDRRRLPVPSHRRHPMEWPDDRFDVVWTLTRTTDSWRFTQTAPTRAAPGPT